MKDVSDDELADIILTAEDQDDGREKVLVCNGGNSPEPARESRKRRRRDDIKQVQYVLFILQYRVVLR